MTQPPGIHLFVPYFLVNFQLISYLELTRFHSEALDLVICAVLPFLELDRLGIAHPHMNSDVVEGKRISVISGSQTMRVLYR